MSKKKRNPAEAVTYLVHYWPEGIPDELKSRLEALLPDLENPKLSGSAIQRAEEMIRSNAILNDIYTKILTNKDDLVKTMLTYQEIPGLPIRTGGIVVRCPHDDPPVTYMVISDGRNIPDCPHKRGKMIVCDQ